MNTPQAKFILHGYRPNGADAADETFAEALNQVRHDAELATWWTKHSAFDRVIGQKLDEVRPPAGLREAILAGGRVSLEQKPFRAGWRAPAWLAMAASIALVGAVSLYWGLKPAQRTDSITDFVLADAGSLHGHLDYGQRSVALQTTMASSSKGLVRIKGIDYNVLRDSGCRSVKFQGRELMEVCFERDGVWFHCYIAQRADFPTLAAALVPTLVDKERASIAAWADAAQLYLVVSESGRAALEKIL